MPLSSKALGTRTDAVDHFVDSRWLMAFSAGLGESQTMYFDTSGTEGIASHPLFPICLEWPVALESRERLKMHGLTAEDLDRGVHAWHDMHIGRLVKPDESLTTTSTVIQIRNTKNGAYVTTRFDTIDTRDFVVAQTFSGMFLRDIFAEDRVCPNSSATCELAVPPKMPNTPESSTSGIPNREEIIVQSNFAHVYTECARIYNPIHTDVSVALKAGLPDIILHGSATLALAVSLIVKKFAEADPSRVVRISCRFSGMVFMPSSLELKSFHGTEGSSPITWFEVSDREGRNVISNGSVTFNRL